MSKIYLAYGEGTYASVNGRFSFYFNESVDQTDIIKTDIITRKVFRIIPYIILLTLS